jgi:hypothetical protein
MIKEPISIFELETLTPDDCVVSHVVSFKVIKCTIQRLAFSV